MTLGNVITIWLSSTAGIITFAGLSVVIGLKLIAPWKAVPQSTYLEHGPRIGFVRPKQLWMLAIVLDFATGFSSSKSGDEWSPFMFWLVALLILIAVIWHATWAVSIVTDTRSDPSLARFARATFWASLSGILLIIWFILEEGSRM